MRRLQVVAVRLLFALPSLTLVLANGTNSMDYISTTTLAVITTSASNISSTKIHHPTTNDDNNATTTSSVHPSTASHSSTSRASSAAHSTSSVHPSSTVATQDNDTTVSPSASSNFTDNVTATAASSTASLPSTTSETTTATSTTYAVTSSTSVGTTPGNNTIVLIAVLASIIPILVLVIIAGILFFYRKRLKSLCGVKKDEASTSEVSLALPQYTSLVVNAEEFLDYINDMEKECDFKYAEQFESLQLVGREQTTDQALLRCNAEKNRYINIHPYDVTRVKLLPIESEDGSDYINSSWIPGYYSKREYIAAQGPLPATEDDMWRMIWEYKCKGIIMLTKCMEGGRKKCDKYWPEDMEPVVYGDIQVVLMSEASEENKWTIKKLELSVGQQKRTIILFHFIEWPDNGVPKSPEVLLEFMQVVKTELETAKAGPLVVHCSAGVGRTGTYIAIETLLLQLENERQLDVFGVVYRLRLNRVFMVQTEIQFKFIHQTIGHVIRKQNGDETSSDDGSMRLNHNNVHPTTDPEDIEMSEIHVSTYKATDIKGTDVKGTDVKGTDVKGIDNPGFEFVSQT